MLNMWQLNELYGSDQSNPPGFEFVVFDTNAIIKAEQN